MNLKLTNTAAAAVIKITNVAVVDSNVVLPGSHKLHSASRYIRVTAAVSVATPQLLDIFRSVI